MAERAAAPVVGVVLLVAVTVVVATAVGTALPAELSDPARTAAFEVEADDTGQLTVTHLGGDAVDPAALRVRIRVDGAPLAEQPPVPFFSARGFESGPTGPFNSATTGEWRAGESAGLRVAGTNMPAFRVGSTVEVRLYADGTRIAVETATVQAASTGSPSTAVSSVSASSLSGASPSSSGT